jgi:hypothetical protein
MATNRGTLHFEQVDPTFLAAQSVLILHEDSGTGLRAKEALELLPARLAADSQLSIKLWRLALIREPLLCKQSAMEGASADIIILSVHGRSGVPAGLRDWLGSWLGQKENRPYALGIFLDAEEAGRGIENPVIACVKEIAAASGADLFYGFSDAPTSERDLAPEEISGRASPFSGVTDETPWRGGARAWRGIHQ